MSTRAAVRRSLLNALLDMERVDDAALDEAFRHAQKAAFGILDLRGTSRPIPLDRLPESPPSSPATKHDGGRSEVQHVTLVRRTPEAVMAYQEGWRSGFGWGKNNPTANVDDLMPVAAPPSDTGSEGCPSPCESDGKQSTAGGNPKDESPVYECQQDGCSNLTSHPTKRCIWHCGIKVPA